MSAAAIALDRAAAATPHLAAALLLAVPAMRRQLAALRELGADDRGVADEIDELAAAIAAAEGALDMVPAPLAGTAKVAPVPLPTGPKEPADG